MFYEYQSAESIDDAILATLFSRIVHVPLLSYDDLNTIFYELIDFNNPKKQGNLVDYHPYVDWLIYKSKRVPRKFVNLIRKDIKWEDNGEGYVDIDSSKPEFATYSGIVKSIQKIDDEQIAVNFFGGSRDYMVMQLFMKSEKLLGMTGKKSSFTKHDLLEIYEQD
jgi:hypothetical protein